MLVESLAGNEAIDAAPNPRVAVVVVNFGEHGVPLTVACAASVLAGTRRPDALIVVDNGSDPGVAQALRHGIADALVIQTGSNLGFTGGNNVGIRRALEGGADWVWLLNNDTEVEPDCMEALEGAARAHEPVHGPVGCLGARIDYFDEPDRIWFAGGEFSLRRGLGVHLGLGERVTRAGDSAQDPPRTVTFVTGCSMFLNADALREVGLFHDADFMYVEDAELSLRLVRAGWPLLQVPTARLHHKVSWPEAEPAPHKIMLRDRNRRRLVRRHYAPFERLSFALWFYPTRAAHLLRYLAQGDWARARGLIEGLVRT